MTDVLDATDLNETIKEKTFVYVGVFPSEVDPETMPKPRHICVSRWNGESWITEKYETGEVVSETSHEMKMFQMMNDPEFIVTNGEEEVIDQSAQKLR